MSSERPVLVLVEGAGAQPAKASLEALGQGALMAGKLGVPCRAVAFGAKAVSWAERLGRAGAERLLVCAAEGFAAAGPAAWTQAVQVVLERERPSVVLLSATAWGQERAARLFARLGTEPLSSATGWRIESGGRFVAARPVYGGRMVEERVLESAPRLLTLRPNVFPAPKGRGKAAEVEELSIELPRVLDAVLLEAGRAARDGAPLAEAEVVVCGGRGMGGVGGFRILRDLAEALGGTVGASRAAVDAGWMPPEAQVGQTGTVVSPKLYVACGISGAMQHRAGIRGSRFIAAVNSDPDAPIFRFADAGIAADLFEVVPALTAAVLRRRRS